MHMFYRMANDHHALNDRVETCPHHRFRDTDAQGPSNNAGTEEKDDHECIMSKQCSTERKEMVQQVLSSAS